MKKHKQIKNFSSDFNTYENKKLLDEMTEKILEMIDNLHLKNDQLQNIIIDTDVPLSANIYVSLKAMMSPYLLN